MKTLLTGHKGYVGTHLKPYLESKGHEVIGIDAVDGLNSLASIFCDIHWDVYDVVIHAGAIADSQCNDPYIFKANYKDTLCWLSQVQMSKHTKFLFFSTCMAESPSNWYAWTKRCAEDVISTANPASAIIRPFNIFGGNEPDNRKSLPRKMIDGEVAKVFKDFVRDYIHVNDVCRAVNHIIDHNLWGAKYDIGTGEGASSECLYEIAKHKNPDAKFVCADEVLDFKFDSELVASPERFPPSYKPEINVKDWMKSELEIAELRLIGEIGSE